LPVAGSNCREYSSSSGPHMKANEQPVTNTSDTTSVAIASLSLTGANAGDFAQTNICPASLAAGAQCVLTVTFHPSDVGVRKASLIVSDTGGGGPHTIALTRSTSNGQNGDFTITTASPNAAVSAGQSAAYNLTVTPFGGFSQPIALNCTGLPTPAGSYQVNVVGTSGSLSHTTAVTLQVN
jgi:hypothetical protein